MSIVTIYNERIDHLIRLGDGNRWLKRKADAIERTARVLAPARTYTLRASHRVEQNRDRLGRYQTGFNISATAPYAAAVHQGVPGWIMPKRGRGLTIPASPYARGGRKGHMVLPRVRGQKANPWLLRAARMHT